MILQLQALSGSDSIVANRFDQKCRGLTTGGATTTLVTATAAAAAAA
jgi:hypothetical protein